MSFLRNLLKTKKQIEEERIIELNLVKEEKIRQAKAIQNDLEVGSTTRLLNKKDTIPLIKADLLLTSTLNSFKSKRDSQVSVSCMPYFSTLIFGIDPNAFF